MPGGVEQNEHTGWRARFLGFEAWCTYLVACLFVYLGGFYLAPSNKIQLHWFEYTITIIVTFMLLFRGRRLFADDHTGELKTLGMVTLLLFLPFLWTPDADYLDTVRVGLKRWLFVFSLVVAVFYLAQRSKLVQKWVPALLLVCAGVAVCFVLYNAIDKWQFHNVVGAWVLSANPNQAGLAMGVACILCLSLLTLGELSAKRCLLWLGGATIFALAVLITTARSAQLGLLTAVCCLLYLRTHKKWLLLVPLFLAALAVIYVFNEVQNPEHYILSGRGDVWVHIWESFKVHPWFGQGAQQTYAVITLASGIKLEPHSLYFGIAFYAGMYGLAVFALLIWLACKRGRRAHPSVRYIYFPILVYGMTVVIFEGVYSVFRPLPFWLYTWFPLLILISSQRSEVKE